VAVSTSSFNTFFKTLSQIDLFGAAPPQPPKNIPEAVTQAEHLIPILYAKEYAKPLQTNFHRVTPDLSPTLGGAVYEHADAAHGPALRRFLAVISDLYRSFLSTRRRTRAQFPIKETIPPLAVFQFKGDDGPFTLPCDDVKNLVDSNVGVVSLPSTYRDHPVLWASLAHETGGHDVLHADATLLPELRNKVHALFGAGASNRRIALLWDYWMDEAASDVYGILNIGPSFGMNLALFFAALNARATAAVAPRLRTESGADNMGNLDPHPTDILRLSLASGVVATLTGLSDGAKQEYIEDLAALVEICAPNTSHIEIEGTVTQQIGGREVFRGPFAYDDMRDAAQRVGAMIACSRLSAFGGRSIQELETWDDADESTALRISASLKVGRSVVGMGDDAQILAGATLALFELPEFYEQVTSAVAAALDESFATDPYWGKPRVDRVYLRSTSLSKPALARVERPFEADPLAQHIIEYDAVKAAEQAGVDFLTARPRLNAIPWPSDLVPTPQPPHKPPAENEPLPAGAYDYLVVTWTVEEARALADVLTPGHASTEWFAYTHKFDAEYAQKIRNGAPASKSKRLGSFFPTKIGGCRVLCFKSELHMSQDGPDLPVQDLWGQLISEVKPKLMITTGTAGAIGTHLKLGDVVASRSAKFDCKKSFSDRPFAHELFQANVDLPGAYFDYATKWLTSANEPHLPAARSAPVIYYENQALKQLDVVVTTDFFAFDDSSNFYGLQGQGSAVEMGDAVLGLVAKGLNQPWMAIRNASDPQIEGTVSIRVKAGQAGQIYEKFGYWTTVPSAIACWAAIIGHAGVPVPKVPKRVVATASGKSD
jgi:nucleoside phosphorylase